MPVIVPVLAWPKPAGAIRNAEVSMNMKKKAKRVCLACMVAPSKLELSTSIPANSMPDWSMNSRVESAILMFNPGMQLVFWIRENRAGFEIANREILPVNSGFRDLRRKLVESN